MNHLSPLAMSQTIFSRERLSPTNTVPPESTSGLQNQIMGPQGDCNSRFKFLFTDVLSGQKNSIRHRFRAEDGAGAQCYTFQWRLEVRTLAREETSASGCSSTLTAGSPSLETLDLE